MSSGRKKVPTEARTASRVCEVIEPSGSVAPGSYSALLLLVLRLPVYTGGECTYSDPRLDVKQMMVFLKLT